MQCGVASAPDPKRQPFAYGLHETVHNSKETLQGTRGDALPTPKPNTPSPGFYALSSDHLHSLEAEE